jgi:hypothetical protein
MEIRIKEHMANYSLAYYVQVRRFLFWKNVSWHRNLDDAKRKVAELKELNSFNNAQCANKFVYDGWAVRNVGNLGAYNSFGFFHGSKPTKRSEGAQTFWENSDGYYHPLIEVKAKKLFGKEFLEPSRMRITIELIDD